MSKQSHTASIELEPRDRENGPPSYAELTSQDRERIARTGEKPPPVLRRNFGFLAILGFSLIVLSTWLGSFGIFGVGLANGGPAGLIYTFVIVWAGNLATFTSLAELASMAPTAGGQYHWVSMLAPRKYTKSLSYLTGWLTVCGWQACVASSSYATGLFLQGFIEIVNKNYVPQLWHSTLLMYGALAVAASATTLAGRFLPFLESVLLVIYVLGFFAILVPVVYLGPHGDAKDVFTLFLNEGGWSTQTLSFFVGISGNAFAFLGADSVYHMSEEIQNASTTVPRSMVWSLFINGIVGVATYIAILFCAGNLDNALNSGYTYPFIEVLFQATNSRAGTAVMMMIFIVVDLGLVIGVVAAASRMLWSFARDRGVPGWRSIVKVSNKSAIPLLAIYITIITSMLLGLISVGSPVAFNDAISLTVVALYGSYLVACLLLLWRRLRGSIAPFREAESYSPNFGTMISSGGSGKLTWGPWSVPEPFGSIINAFACAYLIIVFIFSFFPPATPVTAKTMNWACLELGGVGILSALYYFLIARKTYTGPVIDLGVRDR